MARFYYFSVIAILSPWLKKILKFVFLKDHRMTQFYHFSVIVITFTNLADEVCTWRTRRVLILHLREIWSVHLHLHLDFFGSAPKIFLEKAILSIPTLIEEPFHSHEIQYVF